MSLREVEDRPPAPESMMPIEPKADDALTFKLDHPMGALQLKRAVMRHWRQTNAHCDYLFCLWQNARIVVDNTFADDDRFYMKNAIATLTAIIVGASATAQNLAYTLYGTPGLIEMPSAQAAPDGQVTASITAFKQQQRASFSFQLTDRFSGTFRYASIPEVSGPGTNDTFDRSFDLRYRFLDEGRFGSWSPAMAIGLQDFMGTGLLTSEYIVASKTITPNIIATAGLGWGRMGTQNGFGNPLGVFGADYDTRPSNDVGFGGKPSLNQFFKGDAALFGGVTWQYSDKFTFKAEYSSDAYVRENTNGTIDSKSPVNVGLTYNWKPGITVDAAYLYGSELAAGVTFDLNPRERAVVSGAETAPVAIRVRGQNRATVESWGVTQDASISEAVKAGLRAEGIQLAGLDVTGTTARVRYTNTQFRSEAQALGRVARVLTQIMPDSVSQFTLEPMQAGIALSAITVNRADLEALENTAEAANALMARATFADAGQNTALLLTTDTTAPAFTWGLGPYAALVIFNGNAPVQLDVGLELRGRYEITPRLVIKGGVQQSLLGKRELADIFDNPNSYYNVRTDSGKYGVDGQPIISGLTLSYFGRPAANLYSRTTIGYLERMYGGLSTEVLWKPVDSRLAIGAELNYARQRDFDMGLGFQDYETVTGYLSAYYSFDNGFDAQVDAGRYLAGDWGATFALDRAFDNGWKVGAYVTLTDMPFEEYGEGSFDKGIRITVPTDFFLGTASRREVSSNLASLSRDGGARLKIEDRLYDVVRDGHVAGPMGDTWGRVWR